MEDVIQQIINGRAEEESAADVTALCMLAGLRIAQSRESPGESAVEFGPYWVDENFGRILKQIGKILCPLADDVKNDEPEYQAQMTRVRLEYRGIVFNRDLQNEWTARIDAAEKSGALRSVRIAIKTQLFFQLSRQTGTEGGTLT